MQITSPPEEQDCIDWFLSEPSEESFCGLFRAIAPRIIAYFRGRGCDAELAEDLTQDVMLSVYRSVGDLRSRDLFRPWLYRIARNALLQHIRQVSRRVETIELGEQSMEACAISGDPLPHMQFTEWMAALKPDEREIVTLRYVNQLELHEIASAIGIPLGTVQWKVFQARRQLATYFADGNSSR